MEPNISIINKPKNKIEPSGDKDVDSSLADIFTT